MRTSVLTIGLLLIAAPVALAQKFPAQPPPSAGPFQGTPEDQAACRPDVQRFCKAEVEANQSDIFGILACLKRNRGRISPACNGVLTKNGQ